MFLESQVVGSRGYDEKLPIPGFIHRHVARKNLAANNWGDAGVIPSTVVAGSEYSKTYSYTVPVSFNAAKMSIVGFVSMFNSSFEQREVLNANKTTLGGTIIGLEEKETVNGKYIHT